MLPDDHFVSTVRLPSLHDRVYRVVREKKKAISNYVRIKFWEPTRESSFARPLPVLTSEIYIELVL